MQNETVQKGLDTLIPLITAYGLQILGAILILIFGRFAAAFGKRIVRRMLTKGEQDPALVNFVGNMASVLIMAFAVIAALAKFGIQTTSFVAVLGAAGLAVGLALQGSLSNFAAGVLLLVFRPFKIGDLVEVGGTLGSVVDIGIFVTTIKSPDNKKVILPNSLVTGGVITNINGNGTRRVDMVAGIGYSDDIGKAKQILEKILADHPAVLQEPAPTVAVSNLGESSVDFIVRPWCDAADYWGVWSDVTESIKREFDAQGVSIPFPQRDVHLFQETAN